MHSRKNVEDFLSIDSILARIMSFHGKFVRFGYPRFLSSVPVLGRFPSFLEIGSISVSVLKKSPKTDGSSVSVRTNPALVNIGILHILVIIMGMKYLMKEDSRDCNCKH